METRGAIRRAAEQRQAAEQLTQNWLQRQGPYAAAALAQIQRNNRDTYNYDRVGDEEIEPGPVARATDSTFAGLSPFDGAATSTAGNCFQNTDLKPKRSLSLLFCNNDQHFIPRPLCSLSSIIPSLSSTEPLMKQRRITRSCARRLKYDTRANLFEQVLELVFEGRYLHWYEFMRLRGVNRGCLVLWFERRETAGPWNVILKELNALNGTNKCHRCEQVLLLKSHRNLCVRGKKKSKTTNRDRNNRHRSGTVHKTNTTCDQKKKCINQNHVWDEQSAKRTPDFVSCVDIMMSSGMLNWRERGGIRRICKGTYKVHKECCTCKHPVDLSTSLPFLNIDPRYQTGYYEDWTDYERCMGMIRYTLTLKKNLHSFYNFRKVTDPDSLPYGLARWNWFDIQMVNLQSNCPKRYAFTMHLVSLFIAQGELQRFPPVWYADAFVGTQHRPYADSFVESLASTLSEHCLPATDEVICNFLRTRCYPTSQSQTLLGPLSKQLSIFSPFYDMVPLDESKQTNLPKSFETLNEELIDSMSMNLLCSIM